MPAADLIIHPDQAARQVSHEGINVREDSLYTNHKGKEKTGIRKRADQALERLKDALAKVLEPDEAVLYLARAQAPTSWSDQFGLGWYVYNVTAAVLVVTNRRLLDFRLKVGSFGRWSWARSLRGVHWGDIEEAQIKGWVSRELRLKYRNGEKEKYWRLRSDDAKKIKLLLSALLPQSVGETTAAQAMTSLCPECRAALTAKQYQCPQCGLTFKSEQEATWRSLFFPGGGYFYTGKIVLGVGDAVVETLLLGWFSLFALVGLLDLPGPEVGLLEPYPTQGEAWGAAGIFGLLFAFEKLLTIHHARRFVRDFIPVEATSKSDWWRFLGVVSYAGAALMVWALLPPFEPLVRLGSDLAVYRAEFGTYHHQQDGSYSFVPTSTVAQKVGQEYGWVLRLKTKKEKVFLREEVQLPSPNAEGQPGETAGLAVGPGVAEPVVFEQEIGTTGGLIYRSWKIEGNEAPGAYGLKIYLEKTLVKSVTFHIQ